MGPIKSKTFYYWVRNCQFSMGKKAIFWAETFVNILHLANNIYFSAHTFITLNRDTFYYNIKHKYCFGTTNYCLNPDISKLWQIIVDIIINYLLLLCKHIFWFTTIFRTFSWKQIGILRQTNLTILYTYNTINWRQSRIVLLHQFTPKHQSNIDFIRY